ncbi:TetR/AcrR family transcriptional regulator [Streptomyces sp. 15-116A]|uniref:TetR/AcrR family transcriptional regulator n=1 Tax=Streptomyces sp. 15-116A TaxID=2259035 RepID=UPI0021B47F2A|nr:TetR/AcrR family transcriptional regulator [Streptomyces sp. 15-116A]MCT7354425.1 TetR/AcrR family transcriptional regulator [Streptomyces sp. 15-116A]
MVMVQQPPRKTTAKGSGKAPAKARLSADDWADAALAAMSEGGLAAVAVEPLAARLGTTKGSFYWHFANRDALIGAALERWAQTQTEALITELETEPDPERRLRLLFAEAIGSAADDPLEVSLLATADDPRVAAVLGRVTERRVAYVAQLFAEAGFPEPEARRRGLLAYSVYLGHAQLAHAVPASLPEGAGLTEYLDRSLDLLLMR